MDEKDLWKLFFSAAEKIEKVGFQKGVESIKKIIWGQDSK